MNFDFFIMLLKSLKISGFKSFAKKTTMDFPGEISAVVGPNGSGKSNVVEAIAWVLGEQSFKSLRGKRGEDLIFSGSPPAPKMSKASVFLSFLNKDSNEDIVISRAVYKDGVNEYSLNNSRCRLKDVVGFLGKIGLGTSRHHIISQGESDRILSASLKERREMIEDALGLRVYQIKRDEGKRKLEKTEDNMHQIQALRKEIGPHLRFLKKQVDKAAKTTDLQKKLEEFYSAYFSKLKKSIENKKERFLKERKGPEKEYRATRERISDIKEKIEKANAGKEKDDGTREKINSLERELGRYEVMLSQMKIRMSDAGKRSISVSLSAKEMERFLFKLGEDIERALEKNSAGDIKAILSSMKKDVEALLGGEGPRRDIAEDKKALDRLEAKQKEVVLALEDAKEKEDRRLKDREESMDLEKELYHAEIKMREAKNILDSIELKNSQIIFRENEMNKDIEEAEIILGKKIDIVYVDGFGEEEIEKDWRTIERTKIRLEESGNIGGEVVKEYEEITKRDEFLSTELDDLEKSADSLRELIHKMEEKISTDFKKGIKKINSELGRFFGLMFGGGKAELKIKNYESRIMNKEELTEEEGIDILVNLPGKKINSLDVLSGGERALTSIALLFAMSQVNPPPFLILDETDAALDESNSRKYADMLRELSKSTQLVLVTHNRETMEAAKVLYGVTMDGSGISRLLSIKLEEAEKIAA